MIQQNNLPPCDDPRMGCLGMIIGALLGLLFCSMFSSCSTSCKITEADTIHDTCFINSWKIDSIFQHDSTYCYIYQQGDTVHDVQRVYKTKYKVQIKHDSIYINKTDTVFITKTAEKAKVKDTTSWIYILIGGIIGVLIFIKTRAQN